MKSFPVGVPEGHDTVISDSDRLAALEASGLLDTPEEEAFDRIVRLATRITGSPVGLLSLVDGKRQFFKAQVGLKGGVAEQRETPLSHSFCQYVVSTKKALAVADAREHPLLRDNLAVPDLGVVAYLGIPVQGPGGETLGSFCAIDSEPREWTVDEREALADLSQILEAEIELRQVAREREILLRELNHRVKNIFAMVQGVVRLSRKEHTSVEELATAIGSRIQALAQAHELIVPVVAQDEYAGPAVSLQKLVAMLIEPHLSKTSDRVTIDGPALVLGSKATTYLALVIHELATNAAKYGAFSGQAGCLAVRWRVEEDEVVLDWTESGGKGSNQAEVEPGFGTRLIRISIELQLRGKSTFEFTEDGLHRRFRLPLDRLKD